MATSNPWYSLGTGQYANPFKAVAQPIAPGFASVMSSKPEVDSFGYSKPVFSKEVQAFIDKNKGDLKWVADDPVAKFLDQAHLSQLYGFNGGAGESARRKLLEGGVSTDAAKKYADQVARYYNVVGVTDPKKRGAEYQGAGQLYDQLLAQAKGNGFDWGDVRTPGNDAYRVSERLGELGVTSLSDLKWKGDKLYNSKTGKQIDLDKGNRLTYAAGGGGDGFVNYRVGADKNGNPVLYPQWEESSDKGKIAAIASIAANFIPGVGPLAAAGIQAGIAAAGGAGLKGALLAGAGSLAGNVLAPGLSNAVGVNPSSVAGGAIKRAVKGAVSGGVNAGGKGALVGALTGAAGGAAGAGAG